MATMIQKRQSELDEDKCRTIEMFNEKNFENIFGFVKKSKNFNKIDRIETYWYIQGNNLLHFNRKI